MRILSRFFILMLYKDSDLWLDIAAMSSLSKGSMNAFAPHRFMMKTNELKTHSALLPAFDFQMTLS